MRTFSNSIWSVVLVIGSVSLSHSQGPDGDSPVSLKQREYQAALKTGIRTYESWLTRTLKLQQQGASSEQEVSFGRQNLAMLRHDLASTNDDADEACEQTRDLVKFREADYQRFAKLRVSGAVPAAIVDLARRRLANARYLLAVEEQEIEDTIRHLESIIEVCASELRRAENTAKVGSSSVAEIGLIRGRMAFANYLLATENGDATKAMQNLRIAIAERENEANRIEKLVRLGAASKTVLAEARHNWLRAKANLAIDEDQRDAARDALKKLVETARTQLDYLKAHPEATTPELLALSRAALVDCEFRLAQAADADTPLESLRRKPLADLDN